MTATYLESMPGHATQLRPAHRSLVAERNDLATKGIRVSDLIFRPAKTTADRLEAVGFAVMAVAAVGAIAISFAVALGLMA